MARLRYRAATFNQSVVSDAKSITALGAIAGPTVTPKQTLKFTWTAASGITRVGVEIKNGSTLLGYINYPDGDNQLFTVPAGVTALTFNVALLAGSGSIVLNTVSI